MAADTNVYLLKYKISNGDVHIDIIPKGTGDTQLQKKYTWADRWVDILPVSIDANAYYFYKQFPTATQETLQSLTITPKTPQATITEKTLWSKSLPIAVIFYSSSNSYVFKYTLDSSGKYTYQVNRLKKDGVSSIFTTTNSNSWTHIKPFYSSQKPYLFVYNATTGNYSIGKIDVSKKKITFTANTLLKKGLKFVNPFYVNTGTASNPTLVNYLLGYNASDGKVTSYPLSVSGGTLTGTSIGTWDKNLDIIESFNRLNDVNTYFLSYFDDGKTSTNSSTFKVYQLDLKDKKPKGFTEKKKLSNWESGWTTMKPF